MNKHLPYPETINIPSPCFVLDEKKLIRNLEVLKRIQEQAGINILCAFKGYAMWSTFPLLRKYLAGATASSLHEAILCREEFKTKAHLCAPIYFDHEIDDIIEISSHITFNSLNQFDRFGEKAFEKGLQIALRINPEYSEVSPAIYNPCTPGSRLGITSNALPETLPSMVSGLHFHSMCEQNADVLVKTLEEVEKKFAKYLPQISWLNIGGGHLFTKNDYQIELLIRKIKEFREKHQLEIIAEPGAAIGWRTGYLVAQVQDIVASNGISTAMLDVSFAAHMPDCLEMPYQPKVFGAVPKSEKSHAYHLGGNTCLAGDYMGMYHFPEELKVGDAIVFDDMIHYTMVKTNTFNGVQHPGIGILRQNGDFEIVKKFEYADYKNRLS